MLRLLNFPLMVIFIVFFITNIKVEITRVRLNETRFSLTRIIRNITTGLFGLDSALKKVIPIYLGPKKSCPRYILAPKIWTLFWCTEWAWNCQIREHSWPCLFQEMERASLHCTTVHSKKYTKVSIISISIIPSPRIYMI